MVCRSTSTEPKRHSWILQRRPICRLGWRRCALVALVAIGSVVLVAGLPARAHQPPARPVREVVRIQGHVGAPVPGERVTHELTLSALGVERRFVAADWRDYPFSEEPSAATAARPARVALQGSRAELAPFLAARPDQRVTILAAERLGSSDLFVLAIDLCPPR